MADWIDDFFGHHRYAVVFTLDDGKKEIFKEDDYEWETRDEVDSYTNQLMKPLEEYKKGELNRLRSWAKDEIREWQKFLDKVEEEYNKR